MHGTPDQSLIHTAQYVTAAATITSHVKPDAVIAASTGVRRWDLARVADRFAGFTPGH
jgi:hypothetical protein